MVTREGMTRRIKPDLVGTKGSIWEKMTKRSEVAHFCRDNVCLCNDRLGPADADWSFEYFEIWTGWQRSAPLRVQCL
jgi:hypothetical protein